MVTAAGWTGPLWAIEPIQCATAPRPAQIYKIQLCIFVPIRCVLFSAARQGAPPLLYLQKKITMKTLTSMSCWEISHCKKKKTCPAFHHSHLNCWDIAREARSFQCILSVCDDCLVYLLKNKSIMEHGGVSERDPNRNQCRKRGPSVSFM